MNNVTLMGRLVADPELRHTQTGTAMCRFRIAVDRTFVKPGEERQADFIDIVAWQQRAEFVCKYFSKGSKIALTGEIRTGSYTDKDGNKRNTFEVWANNFEFCESKRDRSPSYGGAGRSYEGGSTGYDSRQSAPGAPQSPTSYSSGSSGDFEDLPMDEDLPF